MRTLTGMSVLMMYGLGLGIAQGAEWFETEGANCSGIVALNEAFSALAPSGISLKKGPGPASFYVQLPVSRLLSLRDKSDDSISGIVKITKDQAKDLSTAVRNVAESTEVPMFVTVGTSIATGLLLQPGVGTGAGLLFSHFFNVLGATPLATKNLAGFIASGGEIYHRSVVKQRQSDSAFFLISNTEYRVSLGEEQRQFVIFGCAYPVEVQVNEFFTVNAPFGQDQILKKIGTNTWRAFDLKENRFMGDPLTFSHQKGGHFFFFRDNIENNVVVGKDEVRVSFIGGDWMIRRHNESQFRITHFDKNVFGR